MFRFLYAVLFFGASASVFAQGVNKKTASPACPSGSQWVKSHPQRSYVRGDGTPVSGSEHKAHCQKNPPSYAVWNERLKNGFPPQWNSKNEKMQTWTDDEKEAVLNALSVLPPFLVADSVKGIYRLHTSSDLNENPASNFQNEIALYDAAFANGQNVARVLGHEFSHIYYQHLSRRDQFDYAKTAEWEGAVWSGLRDTELTLNRKGVVEDDSRNNPEEDFANNIEYFLFDPKALKEKSPKVYDWISKKFGDKLKLGSMK